MIIFYFNPSIPYKMFYNWNNTIVSYMTWASFHNSLFNMCKLFWTLQSTAEPIECTLAIYKQAKRLEKKHENFIR